MDKKQAFYDAQARIMELEKQLPEDFSEEQLERHAAAVEQILAESGLTVEEFHDFLMEYYEDLVEQEEAAANDATPIP